MTASDPINELKNTVRAICDEQGQMLHPADPVEDAEQAVVVRPQPRIRNTSAVLAMMALGAAGLPRLPRLPDRGKQIKPQPSFGVKLKELSSAEKWARSLQVRNRVLNRGTPQNQKRCTNLKKMRRQVREQLKAAKQRIQNQIVAEETRYVIEQGEEIQPAAV